MKETWPLAAEVLAAGGSSADAAKAAKVAPRTIRRWRADEVAFSDAVDDARSLMLADIIESGEERHRLRAAQIVLDQAARYRMDRAIEDRISALEIAVGVRSW